MSKTKEDITDQVELCTECHKGFVLGEGGEGKVCDACRDINLHNGAWGHPFQPAAPFEITEQESDA
jgi:hypothetical protein